MNQEASAVTNMKRSVNPVIESRWQNEHLRAHPDKEATHQCARETQDLFLSR